MTCDAPIFVSARFRTGSTMLWNLFRHVSGLKCYYEPCHDNLVAHVMGDTPVQENHRGVTSYWDEYRPLMDDLPAVHKNEFGVCGLFLEASDRRPELENYLRFLIDRSRPSRPVLQFNRVDFRLPWLKARFPEARIVHLFRDPRDQWRSMTRNLPDDRAGNPDENTDYDLVVWAVSLSRTFPFLVGPHIRHSYERHYLLWRLSYLMGARCADVSLSYDQDFCKDPARGVVRLIDAVGLPSAAARQLEGVVEAPSRSSRALSLSSSACARMETACDELLERLGLIGRLGVAPLEEIRRDHASAWAPFVDGAHEEAVRLSGRTFSLLRSHYLDTVRVLRRLGQNARNVQDALLLKEQELRERIASQARSA